MENTETEYLSLDDYVKPFFGENFYIRFDGGVYVCQIGKQPRPNDLILYEIGGKRTIGNFSDIKNRLPLGLRIAASNGQIIDKQIDVPKVIGTISHKLITL